MMGYRLHCSSSSYDEDECDDGCGIMLKKVPERGIDIDRCARKREDLGIWPLLPRTTQLLFEFRSGRAVPRLRESRPLYGSSAHASHVLSRWPRECQVIPEEIHHIEWEPPLHEPLCARMDTDKRPQVPEGEDGIVVYDAGGEKEQFFSGSCLGGRRAPVRDIAVPLTGPDDTTLLFEARFESGNLQKALRVGDYDYNLTLRTDLYTERHTQWFYFRVKNTRAGVLYRFTISNLLKVSSLYREGLRPLLYSEEKARAQHVGWYRAGQDVTYHRNGRRHADRPCYSLSWALSFPYDRDTCYLAHCYPYTHSNLRAHLSEIEGDPERSRFCKVRTLCRSLGGNLVPVLTVTSPARGEGEGTPKPAVVLTARVHPGETSGSWVMKGVVDFLLGGSPNAALLRDSFLFKLVPMLNPDGVIVGNCRCSLSGSDLNRSYKSVLRECFPSVTAVRAMVQRLCEERTVLLYCDFHGHSRRQNAFIYGCESPRLAQKCPHARVFPFMLSRNCPDLFSFQSCRFRVHRTKEGTARVALWRLGILNSFTLEASLCGSDMGQRKGTHFSTRDLQMLGVHFCDTLLDYCDPDRTKYSACVRELQELMRVEASPPTDLQPQSRDTEMEASPTHQQDSLNGSCSSESEEDPGPFQTRKERKVPPAIHKRWVSEPRCRQSNLSEASSPDKKSERLENLRGRGQQGHGRVLLAPLALQSELPHLSKAQLSTPIRLPGLPGLTGDPTIGQLPAWPKAHTASASLEIRSNRPEPLCLMPLKDLVHGVTATSCTSDVKYAKKKKWKITDETQTPERRKPSDPNILKTAKKHAPKPYHPT